MGLFNRQPATMQELLERNKVFKRFVERTMYHVWFRYNLANGNLDDQINMLWSKYAAGTAPSEAAHELLVAEQEALEQLKKGVTDEPEL